MRSTLLLASFLVVIPIISASPTGPLADREAIPTILQTVPVTSGPAGDFVFQGCFVDSETARILPQKVTPSGIINVSNCVNECLAQSFEFGGIENGGRSCFCGNGFGGQPGVDRSKCQVACLDDPSQACGDFNLEIVYALGLLE